MRQLHFSKGVIEAHNNGEVKVFFHGVGVVEVGEEGGQLFSELFYDPPGYEDPVLEPTFGQRILKKTQEEERRDPVPGVEKIGEAILNSLKEKRDEKPDSGTDGDLPADE